MVGLLLLPASMVFADNEVRIVVKAGDVARRREVLTAEAPTPAFPGAPVLADEAGGRAVPVQLSAGSREGLVRLTWLEPELGVGEEREYRLKVIDPPPPAPPGERGVRIDDTERAKGRLHVSIDGKPFTTYRFGTDFARPFCFPLFGPNGERVTRAYPIEPDVPGETTDHRHHLSLWFAFGAVNGVDCWAGGEKGGRTVHRAFEAIEDGPVLGRIRSVNDWVGPDANKLMEDTRELRVYDWDEAVRVLEFEITLRASEGDVTLGDTKEGMFAIRPASTMDVDRGGTIENSRGGINEPETWGKRAEWCDYSGPVGDSYLGIAIFDHPANFRHPTYWMVRNYGLFACNPFGVRAYTGDANQDGTHVIPAGEELTFRYRVIIHEGHASDAGIGHMWESYASPPSVTVVGGEEAGQLDAVIPEGHELVFEDGFEADPDEWQPREGNRWEIVELEGGGHGYQLMEKGKQGDIRAPAGMSLIKDHEVGDFILTVKAKCLTPAAVRGRDINVFLGYQDPTRFYYVHFSNYSDAIHNAICIVNGEPRKPVTAEAPTAARLTTDDFQRIKVVREGGRIEAYIDDMETPIMSAEDDTLGRGLVGIGSFDDTAVFDDVKLFVPRE